jgi:hypothetical protein
VHTPLISPCLFLQLDLNPQFGTSSHISGAEQAGFNKDMKNEAWATLTSAKDEWQVSDDDGSTWWRHFCAPSLSLSHSHPFSHTHTLFLSLCVPSPLEPLPPPLSLHHQLTTLHLSLTNKARPKQTVPVAPSFQTDARLGAHSKTPQGMAEEKALSVGQRARAMAAARTRELVDAR